MGSQSEPPVIHTLKNHLTAIIGFCEIVLHDLPDGVLRGDIVEIHKAAIAAYELVPQLLEDRQ